MVSVLVVVNALVAAQMSEGLSFSYENAPGAAGPAGERTQEAELPPMQGTVYAYATFDMGRENPIPFADGQPQALQVLSLGEFATGVFTPAIRLGFANDQRAAEGQVHLVPWLFDGRADYFAMHARTDTPYDFKLVLDLAGKWMTAWVCGRGDDDWFLLGERMPLMNGVSSLNHVRVEQHPQAAGIRNVVVRQEPWPEGESLRPHPLAKADRSVGPELGFRFQPMRSVWRQPGRHVTIARDPARWMGFPDVAQVGPETLVCAYCDGTGHGGGGGLFVRRSTDLGKTWSDPIRVHGEGVNCQRLQRLRDGTLLTLADLHGVGNYDTVLYDSGDGGKSWTNQRYCRSKDAGGNSVCVPSRITELPDGSWLLAASWFPGGQAWEGTECEQLELYKSGDRGATWRFYSRLKPDAPHSLSEPSILILPDGRFLLYAREGWGDLPGIKAYSTDSGKTWQGQELPFPIVGRTCAGFLKDGRVMLTFRSEVGRPALWAWVGDPLDDTPAQPWGVHFNDKHSAGLKEGALYIDSDGRCGQFTQYFLRSPDSPDGTIDLTVEAEVLENGGCAATVSVPFAGKLRLFPDHVEMAHDASLRADVVPGAFHVYRVVAKNGCMTLQVDGATAFDTDKVDPRSERVPWTPVTASVYGLAFGNERDGHSGNPDDILRSSPDVWPPHITSRVTGCSLWRRAEAIIEDPKTGKHVISWSAERDGFPDQYQLDHIVEIDATVSGRDQGYSGWIQLDDGRIFVVAYTDDTAPRCPPSGGLTMGVSWIRGTYLNPSDLP